MIRSFGNYLPTSASMSRTYATKSGHNLNITPKPNSKIKYIFLSVIGAASCYAMGRMDIPEEYKGPNGTIIDDDAD